MKNKFDPKYIADCRRQIEKAMKDGNSGWELRMCDIMTSAATVFGNRSDAEVDRMKAFLLELTLCSVANLSKKPAFHTGVKSIAIHCLTAQEKSRMKSLTNLLTFAGILQLNFSIL